MASLYKLQCAQGRFLRSARLLDLEEWGQ